MKNLLITLLTITLGIGVAQAQSAGNSETPKPSTSTNNPTSVNNKKLPQIVLVDILKNDSLKKQNNTQLPTGKKDIMTRSEAEATKPKEEVKSN